ncbi:MAG: HipA domain-containing protein [Gammaproteobacteria bacterium]|nr:HipA domain-containing protein [Gammaproteobacteria bacterium]
MEKPGLNVFAGDVAAGRLERSEREPDTVLFTYREHCTPAQAVSLTMPVRTDQYDASGGLLPIFEMNLPEGALRERLRLRFAKAIPEFDDLDLLTIVGASQIGRLRYSQQAQLRQEVPAQDLEEILTYRGAADLFAYLLDRFAAYSGISGIQPKVLIRDEKAPDTLTDRGATHIVKTYDAAEYPELAANELICTRGAAAAGIPTANLTLSRNRRLLVAERFDRRPDGVYLGLEDFCVLEGMRSHGRYEGSYEGVARRMTDFVSPAALRQAREQYALMVAYSCAIENGDAHLKNFAVIYETPEREIRLAPAFDIVSTTPYLPRDTLALTLGGTKRFPSRDALLRLMRNVTSKSLPATVELLDRVAHGVSVAMADARLYGKRHASARNFADRLIEVMTRGLDRLGYEPLQPSVTDSPVAG